MPKLSAGLLIHRIEGDDVLEVLIVHPGGPFWKNKDESSWSIPKGEYLEGDDPRMTAFREFNEEVGIKPPAGDELYLGEIRQPSGKRLSVWSVYGDLDLSGFKSNEFEMEWPKKSGNIQSFPEVDKAEWMTMAAARRYLLPGHVEFLERLAGQLRTKGISFSEGNSSSSPQQALF